MVSLSLVALAVCLLVLPAYGGVLSDYNPYDYYYGLYPGYWYGRVADVDTWDVDRPDVDIPDVVRGDMDFPDFGYPDWSFPDFDSPDRREMAEWD